MPVISDMYLDVGGVRYPAAPFNGWYMCTEIGSRDLGDAGRYDQLPVIAGQHGPGHGPATGPCGKTRRMTELNLAVLHSFSRSGRDDLRSSHRVGALSPAHAREERHGRACPADWTWIVPPAASSATPVFHRYYQNFDQTPNFYRHPAPARLIDLSSRAAAGGAVFPAHLHRPPSVADAPLIGMPQGRFME